MSLGTIHYLASSANPRSLATILGCSVPGTEIKVSDTLVEKVRSMNKTLSEKDARQLNTFLFYLNTYTLKGGSLEKKEKKELAKLQDFLKDKFGEEKQESLRQVEKKKEEKAWEHYKLACGYARACHDIESILTKRNIKAEGEILADRKRVAQAVRKVTEKKKEGIKRT